MTESERLERPSISTVLAVLEYTKKRDGESKADYLTRTTQLCDQWGPVILHWAEEEVQAARKRIVELEELLYAYDCVRQPTLAEQNERYAARIAELEAELGDCDERLSAKSGGLTALREKAKTMQQALEFYAKETSWHTDYGRIVSPAEWDRGEKARKALGRE